MLTTRHTGDYFNETFTDKLITAYRTYDFHLFDISDFQNIYSLRKIYSKGVAQSLKFNDFTTPYSSLTLFIFYFKSKEFYFVLNTSNR